MIEVSRQQVLRRKVNKEDHLEIDTELREGIGMQAHLYDRMDFGKELKVRFRVGALDLLEKRTSRVDEGERGKPVGYWMRKYSRCTYLSAEMSK